MKKRYALLAIGLAGCLFRTFASTSTEPAPDRGPASEAVRQMATYLEEAPPQTIAALAGHAEAGESESRPAQDHHEEASNATEAGLKRIEETESRIAADYPQSVAGGIIRRFVALTLNDVDTDYRPDLSRVRAMNDLMQNAPAAAADLQSALSALGSEDADSEAERAALIKLAAHVGTNETVLPAVESILTAEISRHARLAGTANEERLSNLVDSYTMLISDPRKQVEFVQIGIQNQVDSRVRETLETTLESINRRTDFGR